MAHEVGHIVLHKKYIATKKFKDKKLPEDKMLAPYLAKPLAVKFEVSEETMTNRISNWIQRK